MIDKEKINRTSIPINIIGRWGYSVLEVEGWTTIPNLLLENQRDLNLGNTEMMLLIHLISFMHYGDTPIYPSIETLAQRINQHPRTVQRTIGKLIKMKLLKRSIRSKSQKDKGLSNLYSLEPLVERLLLIAKREKSKDLP